MSTARVWAPAAMSVELVVGGGHQSMSALSRGWWESSSELEPGTDYWFSLDGGEPLPDPRSPWQPGGVHGPSRALDHDDHYWTDAGWRGPPAASLLIYELHTGTFTPEGTFTAAIDKLDHLVDLGVNAVELMPVAHFSGERGWGYDGVGLYAPHESYGGPFGLKTFVNACHERGIAVILDVVYNHVGPDGNNLESFGPYFSSRYSTPWGAAINFDESGCDEVRAFVVDNAVMWLRDYHCDGLRVDAVHAIYDNSAIHILEELAAAVRDLEAAGARNLFVIAESDLNDPRIVTPVDAGGFGLDAQWSDDFHHSLHALITRERAGYYADFGRVADLAKALRSAFVYDGRYSGFRGRSHGRPPVGLSGHRFLAYMQTHDQVGNRARGDRSSRLMNHELLKVCSAMVLTSPFVPLLFMGEEWGATTPFLYFTDHQDPEVGRAVSDGRRREFAGFGWDPAEIPDPQDPATYDGCKLTWEELAEQPHADLFDWHRALIRLRRDQPDLCDGRLHAVKTRFAEEPPWLVVDRGELTIAANFSGVEVEVPGPNPRRAELLLCSSKQPAPARDGVRLPPESVAIYATTSNGR